MQTRSRSPKRYASVGRNRCCIDTIICSNVVGYCACMSIALRQLAPRAKVVRPFCGIKLQSADLDRRAAGPVRRTFRGISHTAHRRYAWLSRADRSRAGAADCAPLVPSWCPHTFVPFWNNNTHGREIVHGLPRFCPVLKSFAPSAMTRWDIAANSWRETRLRPT
jgi:hypothetical protein